VTRSVEGLDLAMGKTVRELEDRIGGLEKACTVTAAALAAQLSAQIKDFSVSIKGVQATREK
jgi:hypothetical protein